MAASRAAVRNDNGLGVAFDPGEATMQRPVQLRWHHIPPSEPLAERVREKVKGLDRIYDRLTGCIVTLEQPSRHHRQGGPLYRVRIELAVPGGKLVVGRDPTKTRTHGDLYAAVNAAFDEARRQLRDRSQRLGDEAKVPPPPPRGVVVRLFPEDGYGFLQTPEGREIYFNARSVLKGGFPRLRVGSLVRFVEEAGDEGPQASTVTPLRGRAEAPRARAGR